MIHPKRDPTYLEGLHYLENGLATIHGTSLGIQKATTRLQQISTYESSTDEYERKRASIFVQTRKNSFIRTLTMLKYIRMPISRFSILLPVSLYRG